MNRSDFKKKTFTHIPVYSGDVSGAASALYEMGGMTVIHDPSGCNSTYNTHDELRWEKKESLIYISGLRESDAIRGNDSRLINDTLSALSSLKQRPSFIAVCNSPVPDIIGTDFSAITRLIELRSGIRTFYVPTNAMHDYTTGAANAFLALAKVFLTSERLSAARSGKSVNLLGLTPFEFPYESQIDCLYSLLEDAGLTVASNWGRGSACHSAGSIERAVLADVSLVVSSTGILAADYLYRNYGIPYVIGDPVFSTSPSASSDLFQRKTIDSLYAAMESGSCENVYMDILGASQWKIRNEASPVTAFIGEPVMMGSAAASFSLSHPGKKVRLIAATETKSHGLISSEVISPCGEAEIADAIIDCSTILGDPLLKNAAHGSKRGFCSDKQRWINMPHLAMSGRMFIASPKAFIPQM